MSISTKGTILALAAANLLASGLVAAISTEDSAATKVTKEMVQCKGINSCKGKSECKTATSSCKGNNACKGQGWTITTAEECNKQGGVVGKADDVEKEKSSD